MTNQKHPLESVAKTLDYLANDWQGKDGAHTVNEEAKYALTTLREFIANEEKVEGLAEAVAEEDAWLTATVNLIKIMQAAKLQLKRQGE